MPHEPVDGEIGRIGGFILVSKPLNVDITDLMAVEPQSYWEEVASTEEDYGLQPRNSIRANFPIGPISFASENFLIESLEKIADERSVVVDDEEIFIQERQSAVG